MSSLALFGFLIWMLARDGRLSWFAILIAVCAAQGILITLVQHYEISALRWVQPLGAALIPPLAWMSFQVTAVRPLSPGDLRHSAGPVLALFLLLFLPGGLDALIPLLFIGYGLAIILISAQGGDALPGLKLVDSQRPSRIWLIIGITLIASAGADALILIAHIQEADALRRWVLSLYSSLSLLTIGAFVLTDPLRPSGLAETAGTAPTPLAEEEDHEVFARLESFMTEHRPYLNPDLSLTQIARRLHVPVKSVSKAVNKVTGENGSRYINRARIVAAQDAMQAGQSITQAMYAAGFNTKSNFNREFLRVVGTSPSSWLQDQS